jgi:hypothetical protein
MSTPSLDAQLDRLELQFNKLKLSLLDESPEGLQLAGSTFQRLAIEFMQFANGVGRGQLSTPARIRRVKAMALGLATLRECLLRQMAYVDRALAIMLPASREKATYAGVAGAYGSPVRGSGTFSGFAA